MEGKTDDREEDGGDDVTGMIDPDVEDTREFTVTTNFSRAHKRQTRSINM